MQVVPFDPEFESQVVDLIVDIQQNEFDIAITADQQPDMTQIPSFYQVRGGNFWVALSGGEVVGTISLLDIGSSRGALRKMFVGRGFRGSENGTATLLLGELLLWASTHGIREVVLGTTPYFLAAHRFYEKNGFREIAKSDLPTSFPVMEVDTKFYHRFVDAAPHGQPHSARR